ncbi:transmembrane protein 45A-like, partial [Gigantopelta aegis]|uniref:transmembrane protein 45A-like n=1 Tax=Gigantopelta aegis TaxID=1735272 RepID=UPI001B889F4F
MGSLGDHVVPGVFFLIYGWNGYLLSFWLQLTHLINQQSNSDQVELFFKSIKIHHITMYGTFLLSGVIDLIALFIRIPPSTTKLFLSLAFFIEALLFWFHANGRDDLNYSVHILLTYVIFSCIMFSALRTWKPNNLFINGGLAFSIILQGTWFIQ